MSTPNSSIVFNVEELGGPLPGGGSARRIEGRFELLEFVCDRRLFRCYGVEMKDRRVAFVREVLNDLVESLDATVRIGRWTDKEAVPAPLRASAALLAERLGRANRIASDRFVGSPPALAAFSAMSDAIRRLDLALVAYQRASDKADTESTLDAEIARVRSDINLDATA